MSGGVLILLLSGSVVLATQHSPGAECSTATECRARTEAAIVAEDYERAHDFAWRVYQTAPRNDPDAMRLLARAQALSGRGDDAFVMLQRLAERGVVVDEVETSEEFRRVRAQAEWPQLLATMQKLRGAASVPAEAPAGAEMDAAGASPEPAARAKADARPALKPRPSVREDVEARRVPEASASAADAASAGTPGALTAPKSREPAAPESPDLPLPRDVLSPIAIAYDAVSARFVLADAGSHTLKIVSESSGNAANLVSPGWADGADATAIAIDPRRGDLWVTAVDGTRSTVRRLQLISGRHLQTIAPADDAGPTRFAALAVGPADLYVLDTAGRRVFTVRSGALHPVADLSELEPTGLAHGSNALYVSHRAGLARIDLKTRRSTPVTLPDDETLGNLASVAWRNGALYGVRPGARGGELIRARLNARGTAVTKIDVLESAPVAVGTLAGDAYYYLLTKPGAEGVAFRRIALEP